MKPTLKPFDAVIFDMDGVLIDSEPLWKIAMEKAFKDVGCSLTRKDFQKTVGLRIDQVISYWYQVAPWENCTEKQLETNIIEELIKLIRATGKPLPGVVETLSFLREKGIKIGLATSSYRVLIETVLEVLDLEDAFDFTHSAEDEKHGKPHPAVFMTVAEKLGVEPINCLVFEDSLTGIISAKAARMTVIAIPEKTHEPNPKISLADFIYDNMSDVLEDLKLS